MAKAKYADVAEHVGENPHVHTEPSEDAAPAPAPALVLVKVRVLLDCAHGKCNDVVEIDPAQLGQLAGQVDADPAAVAYAESLKGA